MILIAVLLAIIIIPASGKSLPARPPEFSFSFESWEVGFLKANPGILKMCNNGFRFERIGPVFKKLKGGWSYHQGGKGGWTLRADPENPIHGNYSLHLSRKARDKGGDPRLYRGNVFRKNRTYEIDVWLKGKGTLKMGSFEARNRLSVSVDNAQWKRFRLEYSPDFRTKRPFGYSFYFSVSSPSDIRMDMLQITDTTPAKIGESVTKNKPGRKQVK